MSIFHFKPLRQQTDEQLMARAAAGSDTAFEELYRRYARCNARRLSACIRGKE